MKRNFLVVEFHRNYCNGQKGGLDDMCRIKELRKKNGWTQEYLGDLVDVQKATISKYEKGIVEPSTEVLKKMSVLFNVSTDYLLGRDDVPVTMIPQEELNLLNGFRNLTQDGREALLHILSVLQRNNSAIA